MRISFLGLLLLLTGCGSSRELFGRYYWIGGGPAGISRFQLEKRVSSLYTDGSLTGNEKVWIPLLTRYAKQQQRQVVSFGLNFKEGYSLDKRGTKGFLVYYAESRTFYFFRFWNFRGLRAEHTPCDLLVESIIELQADSTLKPIGWKDAGAALADFRQHILPTIRARARKR